MKYCEDYIQSVSRRKKSGRVWQALAEVGVFSYSALKEQGEMRTDAHFRL
ncbi:MAG: hypothetical protein K2H41_07120 [Acetatifactor sp.]|nr:hypothetical protein [Acetatifactor sp.]